LEPTPYLVAIRQVRFAEGVLKACLLAGNDEAVKREGQDRDKGKHPWGIQEGPQSTEDEELSDVHRITGVAKGARGEEMGGLCERRVRRAYDSERPERPETEQSPKKKSGHGNRQLARSVGEAKRQGTKMVKGHANE
jgi:hypothetical protein